MLSLWIVWAAAIVITALTAIVTAKLSAVIIFTLLFLLPIISLLLFLIFKPKITLEFSDSDIAEKQRYHILTVKLCNASVIGCRRVRIRLNIRNLLTGESIYQILRTSLPAKDETEIKVKLLSSNCGTLIFDVDEIKVYDFIGFFRRRDKMSSSHLCTVLPNIIKLDADKQDFGALSTQEDNFTDCKIGADLSEIYEIRDYALGDSLRQIMWKHSQKFERLIVKQGSAPLSRSLLVALSLNKTADYGNVSDDCEIAVSFLCSLCDNDLEFTVVFKTALKNDIEAININTEDDLLAGLQSLLSLQSASPQELMLGFENFDKLICVTNDGRSAKEFEQSGFTVLKTYDILEKG